MYKHKRKAISGAFLKSKQELIARQIKDTALRKFAEIQNRERESVLDLNAFTTEVNATIVMDLIVGPGYSE